MEIRDQILLAIRLYKSGNYDIKTFCEIFGSLYYYQNSGYKHFSDRERESLDKIGFVAERYADSQEDLRCYPNHDYSEQQARELIDQVLEHDDSKIRYNKLRKLNRG